jgi:diketogulonate reductase-like aldo/keto reductase
MKDLVKKGKTRTIGVSNFSIADLKDVLPEAKDIPISCNQIEVHPWLPQNELIAFGNEHGILTTCYSPFAGQQKDGATLIKDETVIKLAKKNDMDVGQLLQSWAVGRGTLPLGKSSTPSRIKANLDIRKLSDEDTKALDALAQPGDKGRTNGDFRYVLLSLILEAPWSSAPQLSKHLPRININTRTGRYGEFLFL